PLIITEGAKKAGCLITNSYVAIALPGIYGGYRQERDNWGNKIGKPSLIPQLEVFAQKEREIIFAFDNDTKPKTVANVRAAIKITGGLLASRGCKVTVISWNTPEKGVDDLIFARGVDFFHCLYNNRQPLSNFNLLNLLDLSKYSPVTVDERYLSDFNHPTATAQLIGIKSAKGTGKTERIARRVHQGIRQGQRAIVITHREQLAITIAHRFGIDYRTEIKTSVTQGVLGYALCIDSLHPHANPNFNPDEWREALVIIDEVEQVLWHLLNSDTCQNNRVAIINSFKQLLQTVVGTGGQIIVADADLSAIALDYIRALIGFPIETYVLENQHNPNLGKRSLINYSGNDPIKLVTNLVKSLEKGEKALVHTTGQKAKSKWGTINLESYLKKKFPTAKILRIDSESVADPNHPAMGCMGNLNAIIARYDIVIVSPVVETGVSIDLYNHFHGVWCIAYGLQTVDAVCQTPERLRDNVTRHIWVKATAKNNRIGNGSTSVKSLLYSEHKTTRANMMLLQQAGIDEFDELDVNYSPESLLTWAKRACVVNDGKNNYRDSVLNKLRESGYEVSHFKEEDKTSETLVNNSLNQTRQENYQTFTEAVSDVEKPTPEKLESLLHKRAKTKTERLQERKGNLEIRYGVEVTPELVEKDDKGWYNKLRLHYYLTVGNIYLAQKDQQSLSNLTANSKGFAFKPDINKRTLSAKVKALEILDIEQFLNPFAHFTADSLEGWLEKMIQYRYEILMLLGVTIHPTKDSAIAVAQRILNKLGLKLKKLGTRGSRTDKQRVYGGCPIDPDGREAVFALWLSRDAKLSNSEVVRTLC
ncbi:plasmid replication protein, CyRepA1 family, partial [Hyella patelloides]|uniref:plasmid replication protein, CyRepA1 family n=1 Tax=Hyella patelloides TaxID=1982969 RepID=UPI0011A82732